MSSLNGARVGILEGRMSDEVAKLIRTYGGVPFSAPALREEIPDKSEEVAAFIDRLKQGDISMVIFSTGVGASALFQDAEKLGRLSELLELLNSVTTVCRGPKPSAVLRRNNVQITVSVEEPYTTNEILKAISSLELKSRGVGLVHYGERNVPLAEELIKRGAGLEELCLYEWHLPEDTGPIKELISEIVAGHIDATAFTSQIQVRHLFQIANEIGQADELKKALNDRTVTVAIGPTCASALESVGVVPKVVPEPPKLGPMVTALADYLEHKGSQT